MMPAPSNAPRRQPKYLRLRPRLGAWQKTGAIPHCKTKLECYSFPDMADLLKTDEAKARLKKVPEWELEKKHIERTFEFDDFSESIDFVNAISEGAEEEEHHPDIDIRYNKVRLLLSTHSKGGLTELDFGLAERIDTLAE